MPAIVAQSISILSDAGLGMAMFSLGTCGNKRFRFLTWYYVVLNEDSSLVLNDGLTGLFMALQPRIIACGNSIATFAMAIRFLTGPAVMAAASIAVGLRGVLLHVAIVQVPFSFLQTSNHSPPFRINLPFVTGSSSSRDRTVCVCKRVQCAPRYFEHCVS